MAFVSMAQSALAQTPRFFNLEKMPPADSLTDEQVQQHFFQMCADLKTLSDSLAARAALFAESTANANAEMQRLKSDSTTSRSQLEAHKLALNTLKNAERNNKKQLKAATSAMEQCEKSNSIDPVLRRKNLPKTYKTYEGLRRKWEPAALPPEPAAPTPPPTELPAEPAATVQDSAQTSPTMENKPAAPKAPVKNGKKIAVYDPTKDPNIHPPKPPCLFATEQRDEFSGELRRELRSEEWFRHTNPVLRAYLNGKSQITGEAALVSSGQNISLSIYLLIHDPNVRKSFGNLPKNGTANLKMMDGTLFTLYNLRGDEGTPIPDTDAVAYRANFALTPAMVKKIGSTETDKLRIHWSTGYEDYDIQRINLLRHQLDCLR